MVDSGPPVSDPGKTRFRLAFRVVDRPLQSWSFNAKPSSLSLVLDTDTIYTFDREGRLFSVFEKGTNYRRGLDGRIVSSTSSAHGPRWRWLDDEGRHALLSRLDSRLRYLCDACRSGHLLPQSAAVADGIDLAKELARVSAWDAGALDRHAARFRSAYGSVPILPPDQYMSLVLQLVSGCPWNRCTFCDLYRDRDYRVKSSEELAHHLQAVRALFGAGLSLRRSLFLGDGNLLSVPAARLLPMLQQVREAFPEPRFQRLYGFSDVIKARTCDPANTRDLYRAGLRRLYIGMETGSSALRDWLNKPGDADEVVEAVRRLRQAGISVGLIILLGAGGRQGADLHEVGTTRVLQAMDLNADDRLLFSPLRVSPTSEYARRLPSDEMLSESQMHKQRQRLETAVRASGGNPRAALYDISAFTY